MRHPRYRLTVEYDGSDFFGWQWQPHRRTVQGAMEAALKKLFGTDIRITGAGRTDTGVHALGQVAHFDAPGRFSPETICNALNASLPADIRIRDVSEAAPDFHARYSACWRWYRYRIFMQPHALERQYGWRCKFQLNADLLQEAASHLTGENDFTAFASSEQDPHSASEAENCKCFIYAAGWAACGDEWRFHIVGNRFLRHLVRCLVGAMMDVARGRFKVEEFLEFLHGARKCNDIFCAPAQGLCLMRVGYAPYPALEKDSSDQQAFPFVHI